MARISQQLFGIRLNQMQFSRPACLFRPASHIFRPVEYATNDMRYPHHFYYIVWMLILWKRIAAFVVYTRDDNCFLCGFVRELVLLVRFGWLDSGSNPDCVSGRVRWWLFKYARFVIPCGITDLFECMSWVSEAIRTQWTGVCHL